MWTVSQMSRISGVSVRTLHHYDAIGLLRPSQLSPAGYRLYDQAALERLYLILQFRELEFPLREIRSMRMHRSLMLRMRWKSRSTCWNCAKPGWTA